MDPTGLSETTHRSNQSLHGKTAVPQTAEAGWIGGALVAPALVLTVLGYQLAVLVLKAATRGRSTLGSQCDPATAG